MHLQSEGRDGRPSRQNLVGGPAPSKLGHWWTSSRAFPLQVFREPDACIPNDLREAMDSLCLFVREMSPRTNHPWGILHPAVILHLRVKTQLVSRLSLALRRDYRGLFSAKTIARRPLSHYGLSGMVALPPSPPRSCPASEGSSNWPPLPSSRPQCLDVSPPESLLHQADNPPKEDEACFARDANHAGEVPIQDPSESSLFPWESRSWSELCPQSGILLSPSRSPGRRVRRAEKPRGYPRARRVHLLILQEW